MPTDRLRPEAESALRPAAAPGIDRNVRMYKVTDEIVFDLQVALINGRDERQLVHVLENRPGFVVHDAAIGLAKAQARNGCKRQTLCDVAAGEVEFLAAHEIDCLARRERIVRV